MTQQGKALRSKSLAWVPGHEAEHGPSAWLQKFALFEKSFPEGHMIVRLAWKCFLR